MDLIENNQTINLTSWWFSWKITKDSEKVEVIQVFEGTDFSNFHDDGKNNACCFFQMGVSKNSGTPKWMVYNGKPY